MDINDAVSALGALAQESRLKVFRLLIRAGRSGLPAGDIARTLKVPHNTMSSHLAILSRANLVQARKEGRPHGRPQTIAGHAAEVKRLFQESVSKREIARRLGISRTSVRRFLDEQSLPSP